MAKTEPIDDPILTEALIAWSGWGKYSYPQRDPSVLKNMFGGILSAKLMRKIETLENDFYSSNAGYTAADLKRMDALASAQFKDKHPEISNRIVEILSWCYTYDNK